MDPSPVSPKEEKPDPSLTYLTLLWKIVTVVTRSAPFPFGKGGGIGPSRAHKPTIKPNQRVSIWAMLPGRKSLITRGQYRS